jgi:hypothetical protein
MIKYRMLEEILLELKDKPWNKYAISYNKDVSIQFIMDHPEINWKTSYVSLNENLNDTIIKLYPNYNWDYSNMSGNSSISFEFLNFLDNNIGCIDKCRLSSNKTVSLLNILNNPNIWIDRYLSMNPNICSSYILKEGSTRNWFIPAVSSNPGITARDIYKQLLPLDPYCLSSNPNLPIDYVSKNKKLNWNYYEISKNASLTDIESFHDIPWDSTGLSQNRNVTMEYVNSRKDINWKLNDLSQHVKDYNNKLFDKSHIHYMCSNPNIDKDWIYKNIRYIDWNRLSYNTFNN